MVSFVIPKSYLPNPSNHEKDVVDIPRSSLSDEEYHLFCKAVKMLYNENEFNNIENIETNRTLIMLVYKLKIGLKGHGALAQYFK